MKYAVLDSHDERYDEYGKLADPNRIDYCERHSYDYIRFRFTELEPKERQPNWGKVKGLLQHLPLYDWIFYLDTDAVITNPTLPFTDYIDNNYHMVVGPKFYEGHLSSGALLVKNTTWSMRFLQEWWGQERFIHEPYFGTYSGGDGMYNEQSALHYLYDTREEVRDRLKVLPRHCFNSLVQTHSPGDLLVHFPGQINKLKLMRLFLAGKYDEAKECVRATQDAYLLKNRAKVIGKPGLRGLAVFAEPERKDENP